ncbi:Methyltransferase domain-containing protein [Cladophialophora immunda]|nr:Methyltransferase domain-containing protein [Cladophialophora immunda]
MASTETEHGDGYVFSRNFLASARLTAQHFLFVLKNGFLLHPAIEQRLSQVATAEIVDVATGNGIVALTLAHNHPNSKVVALDISAEQYPHAWARPANIEFGSWNIFDPVPEQFWGRFDVVHIRAIASAMYGRDKGEILEKLIKMLSELPSSLTPPLPAQQPGGYLQWHECCSNLIGVLDEHSSLVHAPELTDYLEVIDKYTGGVSSARQFDDLAQVFADKGLVEVEKTVSKVVPHLLKHETDLVLMTTREVMAALRGRKDPPPEMLRELDEAQAKMSADVACGKCLVYLMAVFVGRKPDEH